MPVASQRRGGIASPSTSSDSGTTKMVVTLLSTVVRPAGTNSTAACARPKNAASCSAPTAISAGRSCRPGKRNRRSAASNANAISAENPARPNANQSGTAPAVIADLVIGQALASKTTEPASCSRPARGSRSVTRPSA